MRTIRARFYASGVVSTADAVRSELAALATPERAAAAARFFKTGPGDYGEGDVFIGVTMPGVRTIVARYRRDIELDEIDELLADAEHEHRMAGVLFLVARYRADPDEVVARYLAAVRRGRVDNWDLVDASAEFILGDWLFERDRSLLDELAVSDSLWERRVAVLSTFGFIRHGDASTTLALAAQLLDDPEDLMHKAVGWMLREVGKKVDRAMLLGFLDEYAARMPRTMLSYATEHLDPELRKHYRAQR